MSFVMPIVYLRLGTNPGDRARSLERAIGRFGEGLDALARSAVYETDPRALTEQPDLQSLCLRA
jgi:7,8-dihydro-6-hydroxymethylpterin-pyrophosphokinase